MDDFLGKNMYLYGTFLITDVMRNNLIIRLFLLAGISAAIFYGCGQNKYKDPDSIFAEYIEAYTGGVITGNSSIVIELKTPADGIEGSETEISKAAAALFKFSPAINGSAKWVNSQRIEFVPDEGELKPGKTYKGSFSLGDIIKTDKAHRTFKFSFTTARKEAYFEEPSIIITESDKEHAAVSGTLALSEDIASDDPASLIEFVWKGKKESVESEVTAKSGKLSFRISGLDRADKEQNLTVKFKPGSTNFSECENLEVTIPAKDGFKVLTANVFGNEDKYIDIQFSQPLDKEQNLNGLATLTSSMSGSADDNSGLKTTTRITDNNLRIYYEGSVNGNLTLTVDAGIRDIDGNKLGECWQKTFKSQSPNPSVAFCQEGNILPDSKMLVIPFFASNLKAVDISVIEIFPSNILTYLQENGLNGDSAIRRSGRMIYRSTLRLDSDQSNDLTSKQLYTIDLSGLFKKDPNAIYRLKLSFKPEYYIYWKGSGIKDSGDGIVSTSTGSMTEEDELVWDQPYPYYYESNYDWEQYNWADRNNPMTPTYYMIYDYPSKNFLSSDIGVIAKCAESTGKNGKVWVTASNLLSAEPVSGADIRILNYQLQQIGAGKSSSGGLAEIDVTGRPFIVVVKKGNSTSYLRMTDSNVKSLSRFDTGGEKLQKGIKGFIYGERGVWRPGDTLHLTMLVHSAEKLPDTHPASVDIYTPQGQFFARKVCGTSVNGFYAFDIATTQDSPTGLWNAYFKIGGATFHKPLRIETVKPNRLKVNIKINEKILQGGTGISAGIASTWLTGPAASGLKSKLSMTLTPGSKTFTGYDGYTFSDPASSFTSMDIDLLDSRLDNAGTVTARVNLPKIPQAPGMLKANVLGSVVEEGGDESYSTLTLPYSPYTAYVGAEMPSSDSYLETGKDYSIPVAVVDASGKRVQGHNIEWRIFKLKWSWWWESRQDPLDSYVNGSGAEATLTGKAVSGNGDISVQFTIPDDEWGRYLIYIKDLDSGHATGGTVYVDWPAYRGRSDRNDPDAPAMLSFSLDKRSYKAGETAIVYIPSAENGRALVSIENGSEVMSSEWVKTSGTDTPYKIRITDDMAPNFYVHITLVQPYRNSSNDLPVRMYGVQPVMVENPDSHLNPVITMADKVHPEEPFTIKVSEKNGKPMTYTLAIVDEGLLDLTAFRTPDPWNAMYKREALGISTWDIYDDVFCNTGGPMSAMFSIGGDMAMLMASRKENRFNPVVKFMGPFRLGTGADAHNASGPYTLKRGSITHTITLPMYVGSVRVMVVAGNDGAYGNAEKTVPVTSPVMILPTLPRVAGTGEKITLPVNVFVMEDGINKVNVSVKCEGPLTVDGSDRQSVDFNGKGDQIVRFALNAGGEGPAKVTVIADGNEHRMTETVNIEVRDPAPDVVATQEVLLGKGESKTFTYKPFATEGSRYAKVEACSYPSIDWDALFNFMTNYQHYCTEQLAAKGLSLLYAMPMLSQKNAEKAKSMIPSIFTELYSRQMSDGGFVYWPGNTHSDEWITSMAGEFFAVARANGYDVNTGVVSSWLKFQKQCVRNYKTAKVYELSDLTQAYRLYSMALADKADEAAMNRMKESGNLSWQASMMLSSAYSVCGKKNVGNDILNSTSENPSEWKDNLATFGTPMRDRAIAIEALVRTGNISSAIGYANSKDDDSLSPWSMSTQESAFISKAMSLLAKNVTGTNISIDINDGSGVKSLTAKPSDNSRITTGINSKSGTATVQNESDGSVYVRLTTVSRGDSGKAVAANASGLKLDVKYLANDGSAVNPASLRQGSEFTAVIRVTNPSTVADYYNMALTEIIPSGWEIINERMTGQDVPSSGKYDYLDIRDDRNVFYFSLPRNTYKEFRVRLRAAYEGEFILPSVTCEAMYSPSISARTASGTASVTR